MSKKINIALEDLWEFEEISDEEFLKRLPKIKEEINNVRKESVEVEEVEVEFLKKINKTYMACAPCCCPSIDFYVFKLKDGKFIVLGWEDPAYPIGMHILNENIISDLEEKDDVDMDDIFFAFSDENWTMSEYKNEIYSCLKKVQEMYINDEKNEEKYFYKYFSTLSFFIPLYEDSYVEFLEEAQF